MSCNSPLLSIVVPTRNRAKYAIRMVDSILSLPLEDFELVIGDNSDGDQLEVYAKSRISDRRLKYQRVPGILSMTENHNLVLKRACGDYVMLIGDDDTILPSALDIARWAKSENWEAVTPACIPSYVWPDARHWFFGSCLAGKTYFLPFSGKLYEMDNQVAIKECLGHAGQGVRNLPKIYHGIIKRNCLEYIREKTGTYFQGASPDIYGALALGTTVQRYCRIDYPLSIAGIGGSSNSGRAARKQHKGELTTDPHMKAFAASDWPSQIPDFFSVETVWAEACLMAVRAFGLDESMFDIDYLYAKCLFAHPLELKRLLTRYFSIKGRRTGWAVNLIRLVWKFIKILYEEIAHLVYRSMRPTRKGWQVELTGGEDINTASHRFQEWLGYSGIKPCLDRAKVD